MSDLTPPHDLAAERCVLGGMMLDGSKARDAIADVDEILSPGDHYRPAHQVIHGVILDLYGRGEPADPVAVHEELVRQGEDVRKLGGPAYLHTLLASVPAAVNAGYYAKIVRQKSILRGVIEAATHAAQMAYESSEDAEEIAEQAARAMDAVAAGRALSTLPTAHDLVIETLDDLAHPAEKALPMGFADLDAAVTVRKGQMVVIAARPAVGKSLIAAQIAEHLGTELGVEVLYMSLEMRRDEIMQRRLAARAKVPLHNLTRHELTKDDWRRLDRYALELTDSKMRIDDNPIMGLPQLKARIRSEARAGRKPQMVIVDLLGLMQPPKGKAGANRQEEVAALSRGLKLIAREYNIVVMPVVQLNRGPEQRADKRPVLSDLRESGQIEADADTVILLHREDVYEKDSPRAGEADAIIAKQRRGPTATITLAFQGHYARFVGMAPEDARRDPSWSPSAMAEDEKDAA